MTEPIKFHAEVNAEDSSKYPDMRLRLLIRQAYLDATKYNELTLDEALHILQDETDYLEKRIGNANERLLTRSN